MLLSVIIPMYNGEQYISYCIKSIVGQGLSPDDYEIIVIDDGSSDNGAKIVLDFSRRQDNIKIIQQSNQGLWYSRNKGIDSALGDWIHFVDCDDKIEDNSYKKILAKCFNRTKESFFPIDVISFKSATFIDGKNTHPINTSDDIIFNGSFYDYVNKFGMRNVVWGYWIRKDFLKKKELRFKKFAYAEDLMFNLDLFHNYNNHICVIDVVVYHYIKRKNSITTSKDFISLERSIKALADVSFEISSKFKKSKYNSLQRRHFSQPIISRLLMGNFDYKKRKELIDYCVERNVFPLKDQFNTNQEKFYNFLIRNSKLMSPISLLYRNFFIPYIKPHIDLYSGRLVFKKQC